MENNYIIVLMHIQTSIAFGRPADATILLFWNKKDKSGDNQKALYPTRWPKYCNAPCCARLQSFSVSSPLSVCSFVHGFLLFTVMPNTFMITGGKGVFCCSFYSSFFTAKSWGPYLNSSAHIYLEDFLFMVCHHLFKTWICQKIPAARDTRGGLCFVGGGEGFFDTLLWNTFTIKIPREYLHRVSLENTFSDSAKLPVGGFTLLSTVFRTVFISIGCSIES